MLKTYKCKRDIVHIALKLVSLRISQKKRSMALESRVTSSLCLKYYEVSYILDKTVTSLLGVS